jgi:hypothetical protein
LNRNRLLKLVRLGVFWLVAAAVFGSLSWLIPPSITIRWETAVEQNTAGFFITRSQSLTGPFLRIHDWLIPSVGNSTTGGRYHFVDREVTPNTTYFYLLEEVELDTSVTRYASDIQTYVASRFSRGTVMATAVATFIGLTLILIALICNNEKIF